MGTMVKQKNVDCNFKQTFLEKLWLPRQCLQLMDIGFIRFDKGQLSYFYVVMILNNGRTAIARYNMKLQPTHLYITIDDIKEERYDLLGRLDGTYLTTGDSITRVEDDTKYDISHNTCKFPREWKLIRGILDKDPKNKEFRYFVKDNGDVLYLYVNRYCECKNYMNEKKPIQLEQHIVCDTCKRFVKD